MRERLIGCGVFRLLSRITLAYAGKTLFVAAVGSRQRDHPRVCGKDWIRSIRFNARVGSPPRMRERLHKTKELADRSGITPAYAGKTYRPYTRTMLCWDHPRVCGKDFILEIKQIAIKGSPPRMRERHCVLVASILRIGITPAYAGKT